MASLSSFNDFVQICKQRCPSQFNSRSEFAREKLPDDAPLTEQDCPRDLYASRGVLHVFVVHVAHCNFMIVVHEFDVAASYVFAFARIGPSSSYVPARQGPTCLTSSHLFPAMAAGDTGGAREPTLLFTAGMWNPGVVSSWGTKKMEGAATAIGALLRKGRKIPLHTQL